MPRDKRKVEKRELEPDNKYNSILVTRLINKIMIKGKKEVARTLVYDSLDIVSEKLKADPSEVLDQAVKNVSPQVQIKSRRIGGATYQVPMEVKGDRKTHYALIWVREAARSRKGESFAQSLAKEIMDAYKNEGTAIKKKEETHRMAEANKAFAHFAKY